MKTQVVTFMFPPDVAGEELATCLEQNYDEVEKTIGHIVGIEHIEQLRVVVVGRRYHVEIEE